MTTPDSSLPRRINDLRDQVRWLNARLDALLGHRASGWVHPNDTRLAVISSIVSFGTPDAIKGVNKYWIEFLDGDYNSSVSGQETLTSQLRGSNTVAFDLHGGFILPGSIVIVARSRGLALAGPGEWWICYSAQGPYYFKVLDGEKLSPGGSALCSLMRHDGGRLEAYDPDFQIEVCDADDYNADGFLVGITYALPGERIQAIWRSDTKRFETFAEWGLIRTAMVTEPGGIDVDDSGEVTIWVNDAVTSPAVTETAWLNWMEGDEPIDEDTEVLVRYFRDSAKWRIIGSACEPTAP